VKAVDDDHCRADPEARHEEREQRSAYAAWRYAAVRSDASSSTPIAVASPAKKA
jgi:hypothetical protein